MSIKSIPGKEPVVKSPVTAWGRMTREDELARAICFSFSTGGRTVSFPVAAIARWEFSPGNPDSLVLKASQETITILGRKLATLRDALNAGRLLEVTVAKPGDCAEKNETTVSEIRFAVAQ